MLPLPAVKVRSWFPFIVLENVIVPVPDPVDTEVISVKFTAQRKETAVLAVKIVPDNETVSAPF